MAEQDENEKEGQGWNNELLFTQLILSFQAAAWQQLGKVPGIISGKIERNLEMAKHSIDMMGMLEEKTRGNLSESEKKYLEHTLFELRMNYLDELKKGPDRPAEKPGEPPAPADNADNQETGK